MSNELVLFDISCLKSLCSFEQLSDLLNNVNHEIYNNQILNENLFKIRSLELNDYSKGYLNLLSQLTVVGNVSKQTFIEKFNLIKSCPNSYFIVVIENCKTEEIIATITLFIEHKFIRNASKRGRIEDVVVLNSYRHFKIGKMLVNVMKDFAHKLGCYKVTLECNDHLIDFYGKNGFIKEPNQNFMSLRF